MNINEALSYIETQIAHHGAMLEKYMLAKQVLEEAAKRRPKAEVVAKAPRKPLTRRGQPSPTDPTKQAETAAQRAKILEFLTLMPRATREIIHHLGGATPTKVMRDAIYNRLQSMLKKGQIVRLENGNYALPDEANRHEVAA